MDAHKSNSILSSKRIAVIGAGAAGLVAIKTLRATPEYERGEWEIIGFERRHALGGIWLPDPISATPAMLPKTPLYNSLTTNLPHPIMAFRDFAFQPSTPLYPPASTVLAYLEAYADAFDLRGHIQFDAEVEHVELDDMPVQEEHYQRRADKRRTPPQWTITTRNVKNGNIEHHDHIDTLIVGNGRHNLPHISGFSNDPSSSSPALIPGLAEWLESRHAVHAMYYRTPPAHYQGRTILIVGNGPSAKDIAPEIATVAKVVWRSVKSRPNKNPEVRRLEDPGTPTANADIGLPYPPQNPTHDTQAPILFCSTIVSLGPPPFTGGDGGATPPNAFFADGSPLAIDYIVFATGYDMAFPFLSEAILKRGTPEGLDALHSSAAKDKQPPITLYPKSLSPLLYHLIPSSPILPFGSLFVLCLPRTVVPFPLDQAQCHLLTAILQGKGQLSHILADKEAGSGKGIFYGGNLDPEREADPKELSHRYHLFAPPNDDDQFDYREFIVRLGMSTTDEEETKKEMEHMVPAWQRMVYENKLVLRSAWRDLERRGVAEDMVRDVGKGENAEQEWVELMERLLQKDV